MCMYECSLVCAVMQSSSCHCFPCSTMPESKARGEQIRQLGRHLRSVLEWNADQTSVQTTLILARRLVNTLSAAEAGELATSSKFPLLPAPAWLTKERAEAAMGLVAAASSSSSSAPATTSSASASSAAAPPTAAAAVAAAPAAATESTCAAASRAGRSRAYDRAFDRYVTENRAKFKVEASSIKLKDMRAAARKHWRDFSSIEKQRYIEETPVSKRVRSTMGIFESEPASGSLAAAAAPFPTTPTKMSKDDLLRLGAAVVRSFEDGEVLTTPTKDHLVKCIRSSCKAPRRVLSGLGISKHAQRTVLRRPLRAAARVDKHFGKTKIISDSQLRAELAEASLASCRFSLRHKSPMRVLNTSVRQLWLGSYFRRMSYEVLSKALRKGRLGISTTGSRRVDSCKHCFVWDKAHHDITTSATRLMHIIEARLPDYMSKFDSDFTQLHAKPHIIGHFREYIGLHRLEHPGIRNVLTDAGELALRSVEDEVLLEMDKPGGIAELGRLFSAHFSLRDWQRAQYLSNLQHPEAGTLYMSADWKDHRGIPKNKCVDQPPAGCGEL